MIIVDVQHPEAGEWYRAFATQEEADRYLQHITKGRGMIAAIRKEPIVDKKELLRERVHGRRHC
jgi:hypothetical protein